jgi:hypothetical protein
MEFMNYENQNDIKILEINVLKYFKNWNKCNYQIMAVVNSFKPK